FASRCARQFARPCARGGDDDHARIRRGVSSVIATGDIARILTFRSVAVLGLAGTGVLDERKGRRCPIEWARFAWRGREGSDSCAQLCSSGPPSPAPVGLSCSPVAGPRI